VSVYRVLWRKRFGPSVSSKRQLIPEKSLEKRKGERREREREKRDLVIGHVFNVYTISIFSLTCALLCMYLCVSGVCMRCMMRVLCCVV